MGSKFSGAAEFKAGNFSYDVGGGQVATLDVAAAFPAISVMEDHEVAALHFAIKTAARNARASIKPEQIEEAFKAVTERFQAWSKKVWRAASESTGEARTSLLAKAVAEVLSIEVAEAAEQISGMIEEAIDSAGLSRDEDADKAKIRKIGTDVRDQLKSASDVAKIYARLQAEEAVKRSEKAQAATSDKPALADVLKR
jgi:hypothetical protein